MTNINPGQLKALNTLVSKLGIDKEEKAMMVEGFSGGRCTSSKDLYIAEAAAMINHLKHLDPEETKAVKMRNKVYYYAHEMHWEILKNGKMVVDAPRVDQWCIKYSYLKKKLDRYTYKELPKLVSQIATVYKHYINNL